ncbi:hypothetical protein N7456_001883 [Penicillium angulare]|uniref:penicillopepsin n=1 Tax=Penicillium angulare TaxID=116970 RepID=A0A9W9G719_9EURO|nr:hypothetical protein N7456_001883 [Penicillium angulare]
MKPSQLIPIIAPILLGTATAGSPRSRGQSSGQTLPLRATTYGSVFDVPVTIGNQTFQLLLDTGSSDTYVMEEGFTCVGSDNMIESRDQCQYSNRTYHESETYRQIPGQIFGIKYGAGTASGRMAYEQVTMGNTTVLSQKVGIANVSQPMGDYISSGLVGLAYPALTSAHPSNHTGNSTTYWRDRLVYSPLLNTMAEQGQIDPYFSLALAHTPQNASTSFGGYITLGGLPPVKHSSHFSTVPVEITSQLPLWYTSGKKTLSYWSLTVENATYGSSANNLTTNSTSFQVFVDSGNDKSYLPVELADAINARFDPPATKDSSGLYIVDCNAKSPEFGLTIGDQTFFHNGSDLIYKTSDGPCVSAVGSSESASVDGLNFNIIGVPLLKNVVAVFDFGKDQMRFAKTL